MNRKDKAVTAAATVIDGKGLTSLKVNYTPQPGTIASLLLHGEGNAISAAELARITGQTVRDITRRISQERRQGAPIMSSPASGYWIAEDAAEIKRCVAALHARAAEIHKTAKALEDIRQ